MEIFEIIWPGSFIVDDDRDWAFRIYGQLHALQKAYAEAYLSLLLFERSRDEQNMEMNDLLDINKARENGRRRSKEISAEVEEKIGALSFENVDRFRLETSRIGTQREFLAGKLPRDLKDNEIFIYAKSFVYSLDYFERNLAETKKDPKCDAKIHEIHEAFIRDFPDLRATLNSAHHMEDRIRGLGTSQKKIEPQPFVSSAINAAAEVLVVGALMNGSLSFTNADGTLGQVEISDRSLRHVQNALQQILDCFSWSGGAHYFPNSGI